MRPLRELQDDYWLKRRVKTSLMAEDALADSEMKWIIIMGELEGRTEKLRILLFLRPHPSLML
jgi:hypothetical protein